MCCRLVGRDELEERGKNSVEGGTEGMSCNRKRRNGFEVGRRGGVGRGRKE